MSVLLRFPSWEIHLGVFQKSAQTVLRGCEEPCGSPRVRTMSASRAPPLLSRLSETSSADESMSDVDSVPCSPLIFPCSPLGAPGSKSPMGRLNWVLHMYTCVFVLVKLVYYFCILQACLLLGCMNMNDSTITTRVNTRWATNEKDTVTHWAQYNSIKVVQVPRAQSLIPDSRSCFLSLVYITKLVNKLNRIEPCGTPFIAVINSDWWLPSLTDCCVSES